MIVIYKNHKQTCVGKLIKVFVIIRRDQSWL